jgi:hypothetical protein
MRSADEMEVADALELLVVRYAGCAVTEPDLGPQIERHRSAAVGHRAFECLSASPLVDGRGPSDVGPGRPDAGASPTALLGSSNFLAATGKMREHLCL